MPKFGMSISQMEKWRQVDFSSILSCEQADVRAVLSAAWAKGAEI